jgi:hypothetical protein
MPPLSLLPTTKISVEELPQIPERMCILVGDCLSGGVTFASEVGDIVVEAFGVFDPGDEIELEGAGLFFWLQPSTRTRSSSQTSSIISDITSSFLILILQLAEGSLQSTLISDIS